MCASSNFEIKQLIKQIISNKWEKKLEAADKLASNPSLEVTKLLILLLKNNNPDIRNASALALREIGSNLAVLALIDAINVPCNKNNRSTLVYALETLDCSKYFLDIFKLALAEKQDVQISALNILDEQKFYIDNDDVHKGFSMLSNANKDRIEYKWLRSFLNELLST